MDIEALGAFLLGILASEGVRYGLRRLGKPEVVESSDIAYAPVAAGVIKKAYPKGPRKPKVQDDAKAAEMERDQFRTQL